MTSARPFAIAILAWLLAASGPSQTMGQTPAPAEAPTSDSPTEVVRVGQPAFAWAVASWYEINSARKDAARFRSGGYYVRIVPDEADDRYRVTLGHYLSVEAAREDEIGIPIPARVNAEIVPVEREVVFRRPPSVQSDGPSLTVSSERINMGKGGDPSNAKKREEGSQQTDIPSGPLLNPIEIQVSASTVFDSNIGHDHDPADIVQSVGFVPGLLFRYRTSLHKPVFVVSYGIAQHAYSQTDEWDRTSHMLLTQLRPRLGGSFRTKTSFDLSRNGTFEDRDLSDQIQFAQEAEYRFTRHYRLHAYGTLRWKRPSQGNDNAFKPNVGAVFEQKLGGGRTWEMGARYEINNEERSRGDYTRWTFEMDYDVPLSDRSVISFGIKHRLKHYSDRYVTVEKVDVLRRDARWIIGFSLDYALTGRVLTNVRYKYETRNSNHPGKPFQAHLLDFGIFVLI